MELARRLAEIDLPRTGAALPRGPLPPSVGAEQAQWRGIAEVEGELITGDDHAISLRAVPPIRWSPGYRNITLAPVSGLDEAFDALLPFAPHLKCVGADGASRVEVEARLEQSAKLAAYACPLGEMQTPALDAPADLNGKKVGSSDNWMNVSSFAVEKFLSGNRNVVAIEAGSAYFLKPMEISLPLERRRQWILKMLAGRSRRARFSRESMIRSSGCC